MTRQALFLAALLAPLAGCPKSEPLPYSGFLDAPISAVASQVSGKVQLIAVREGDRVQKGQLLARLDSREREAAVGQAEANLERERLQLAETEANLRATQPTVKGAGADIARVQATLDEAQENYSRTQRLARGGAATRADLDAAEARLHEAQASLRVLGANKDVASGRVLAAMAAVSSARAAIRVGEAALEVAKVQLAQAEILAPFDGLVVDRALEEGEWAAPGTPVVTVEDLKSLWVRLDVEETQFSGLQLDDPAAVSVVAFPDRTFQGHVIEVGPLGGFAINRDVKRGRPDIRTFRVRVALDESADTLRPGMTAEVRFGGARAAPDAGAVAGVTL